MKLSPFMTQVKKGLKNKTKEELIEQVLMGIELSAQQTLSEGERYENLFQELLGYKKLLELREENIIILRDTIQIYKNMSVWQFIKSKFK